MSSTTQTYAHHRATSEIRSASAYDLLIEKLVPNHFALISMSILIGSIAGGIAAMYVFMSGAPFWQFILGLSVSMANLIASIAQAPTKWVFNIFALSIILNLILVFSNL